MRDELVEPPSFIGPLQTLCEHPTHVLTFLFLEQLNKRVRWTSSNLVPLSSLPTGSRYSQQQNELQPGGGTVQNLLYLQE